MHPDVYVDPIAVTKSADIPADFSNAVKDEITTQLNAASRITPLEGDGKRHDDAYQMSGNVRNANGKLTMFAKIFAPGIAAPVLSPRIEVPEVDRSAVVLGKDSRALVFLNACQVGRTGAVLSTIGGWAEALINREFGAVIAPLWAVNDADALTVVTEF